MCVMKRLLIFLGSCLIALAARADTTLFNNGVWIIQGATDPATNAVGIVVTVGGIPAGTFSELKISHAFTGAGFPQIFSVKGTGEFQPVLPPPGVPGGSFFLTEYWDCGTGFVPGLFITQLDLDPNTTGSQALNFTGRVTNQNSMQGDDLKLRFYDPSVSSVSVGVSYSLTATRDFCIDQSRQAQRQGFPAARMRTNFINGNINQNDLLRYITVAYKQCDCCSCWKINGSVCGPLNNLDLYLVCFQDNLRDPRLWFVHQSPLPDYTPTLITRFKKPSPKNIQPQGFGASTTSPAVENVGLWGNWKSVKQSYTTGQKVGKFNFNFQAIPPGTYNCDTGTCY